MDHFTRKKDVKKKKIQVQSSKLGREEMEAVSKKRLWFFFLYAAEVVTTYGSFIVLATYGSFIVQENKLNLKQIWNKSNMLP